MLLKREPCNDSDCHQVRGCGQPGGPSHRPREVSAGTRIPSVRRLSDEMRVSVTTVLEAYPAVGEPRPHREPSPVPVTTCGRSLVRPPPLDCSAPPRRACAVGVDGLVLRIMQDTHNPELVQLGAAVPNPALLPTEQSEPAPVQGGEAPGPPQPVVRRPARLRAAASAGSAAGRQGGAILCRTTS